MLNFHMRLYLFLKKSLTKVKKSDTIYTWQKSQIFLHEWPATELSAKYFYFYLNQWGVLYSHLTCVRCSISNTAPDLFMLSGINNCFILTRIIIILFLNILIFVFETQIQLWIRIFYSIGCVDTNLWVA